MTRIKKVTQSIPSSGLVLNEYADSETDTYSTAYLNDQLDDKQDTLTAGTGITIDENNVISSEGREYTAGTGLVLDDTEFSIDTTVVAEKSDLPTVNNATLTLQKNGSTVTTFTANSATDTTANITVPTKTSDLTNDGASGTGTYAESSAVTTVANNLANETNAREQADNTLTGSVNTINGKIPAQASTSNQLADKAFVNSSVQTATANFRGNWDDWADVPTDASLYPADYAGSTTPTVNDYMVLQDASDFPVGTGEDPLEGTWRFKYSGTWATDGKNGWHPEYQVNETPLTAAQLAALNSGITSTAVTQIGTNTSDISSLQTSTNTEFGKVAYIDDTVGTTTNIAYVATSNIQDGAVTAAKVGTITSISGGDGNFQIGDLVVQWKSFSVSGAMSSWGSVYYYDPPLTTADKTWAIAFDAAPVVQVSTSGDAGVQYWASCNSSTATEMGNIRIYRPVSTTASVTVTVLAIGKKASS